MARNLVPLKVKIGLTASGAAKYPQFNLLPSVINAKIDWSKYVDIHGTGWHYDKKYGHKEEGADSPFGMQWGVLLVPKEFADEAVKQFPEECTKIIETELQTFYDDRVGAHMPEEIVDEEALKVFEVKDRMKIPLSIQEKAKKIKALDPNDDMPGIVKNKNKRWTDFKALKKINIIQ